jgi:N-acetylmuramoyl-L-alanine amidase
LTLAPAGRRATCLGVLLLGLAACAARPEAIAPPPLVAGDPVGVAATPTAAQEDPAPPAVVPPTLVTPTSAPPPTVPPTPTAAPALPRVGIQVGHWKTEELPDELARFRTSTGAYVDGITELEVNLAVAERVAALLEAEGILVDLLPATVPVGYQADAFVSIHADGSAGTGASGFKMATPWRTSPASGQLYDALMAEYAAGTGLREDSAITVNMRGYYAFNYRRHRHAIAKTTPAVIVELGFLTNASDRAFLLGQPDVPAQAIASGVLRYLGQRDPADQAALIPKEYPLQRFRSAGVTIHAAPDAGSAVIFTSGDDSDLRFMPFREVDGWSEGFVRGERRAIGWVRADQLLATDEPFPTPTGQ